jgi:hypothetical protein
MSRRHWAWLIVLATALHAYGIARATLPAQDGLKFIRVAREFRLRPWTDVVRASDQHPLYPASIALIEPFTGAMLGHGPLAWRVAAQAVSAIASIAILFPLFGFARAVLGVTAARLTVLLFVLLPVPAVLGHETLSDMLALLCFAWALRTGEAFLRNGRAGAAVGCGLAAGFGYWARPEVVLVPLAVAGVVVVRWGVQFVGTAGPTAYRAAFAGLLLATLLPVGIYALVKGELSEKLALRRAADLRSAHDLARSAAASSRHGLDDPRCDFAPKEETTRLHHDGPLTAAGRALRGWADGLGWVFAPFALWAACRQHAGPGRRLAGVYLAIFAVLLIRHGMVLGYVSGRHALTAVLVTLPWAAAGALRVADRLAMRLNWSPAARRRAGMAAVGLLVAVGLTVQARPVHASRFGHAAAGHWLRVHAAEHEAVLDTRGWAAFVAGRGQYDYWHVRQALSDSRLTYLVVGTDEIEARSRRAATLRALLAYCCEPIIAFPQREGGQNADVCIYRYHRPASWEGLRP